MKSSRNSRKLFELSVSAVALCLSYASITAGAVTLPFCSGFEEYGVGAPPSPPWIRVYNANSIVVDERAFSGAKSYKLRGSWGWSDTAYVDVPFPDAFRFEVACNVENGAVAVGQLQFHGATVNDQNSIWFSPDWDKIAWFDGTTIVPYCHENTWYRAVVTISGYLGSSPTADVIVYDKNGNQLGAEFGLSAKNVGQTPQQHFVLHTRSQPLNGQGAIGYIDDVCIITIITVAIDIKPGSYPNSINLKSKGVVPVAVLTSPDFDATTVDRATVEFAGAAPLRWAWEDVDDDGDVDLLFHFKTQELNLDENSTEATLTGETLTGNEIEGTDEVRIVPGKK